MDSKKMMLGLMVCSVPVGLFFWFCMGRTEDKIIAVFIVPLCSMIGIIAHIKSKRDDKKAAVRAEAILDGSYFRDPAWREAYLQYKLKHGAMTSCDATAGSPSRSRSWQ